MALDILSLQILGGKTGSCLLGDFSTKTSQNPKVINNITARTSVAMTIALLHEYRVPPSSSANTRRTEAARRRIIPSTSMRTQFERRTFARSTFRSERLDDSSEAGRKKQTMIKAIAPPGRLMYRVSMPQESLNVGRT